MNLPIKLTRILISDLAFTVPSWKILGILYPLEPYIYTPSNCALTMVLFPGNDVSITYYLSLN